MSTKKEQITHVALILDRSGSMQGTKEQTVNGFNEQIQQIRKNAEEGEKYLISLITFNDKVYEHFWDKDISEIQDANPNDYVCDGMTAMYDGVGYVLNKLVDESENDKDKDVAYLVVILSDGQENSSHYITQNALKEMIESLDAKNNWTFTYMGCDKSYLQKLSKDMAIPLGNMAAWSNKTVKGAEIGMAANSNAIDNYVKLRKRGGSAVKTSGIGYYSADLNTLADYSEEDVQVGGPNPIDPNWVQNLPPTRTFSSIIHDGNNPNNYFSSSKAVNWNIKNDGHKVEAKS